MNQVCENCRYWLPAYGTKLQPYPEVAAKDKDGYCRRYPPVDSQWSETVAGEWCGEYRAKDGFPEAEAADYGQDTNVEGINE